MVNRSCHELQECCHGCQESARVREKCPVSCAVCTQPNVAGVPPPPPPPSPPPPSPSPPQAVSALATNVECVPYKQNEALLDFSGAKRQRFLHCAHPPPAERARIVPVPQGRTFCTTTWAALLVPTVRRSRLKALMTAARQTCRGSPHPQDAPVRPWTTCATGELVRWPRTRAVPTGTGLPQRSPRRASCAVFGNVFAFGGTSSDSEKTTSAIFPEGGPNGDPTQVDLYIENITYYYNADGGDHHLQTKINGKFAQINLDGPNNDKRGTSEHHTPHETTFKFEFRRRDNGQPVSIPWMQFTFFDFDENVLTDWLKQNGGADGDGREARLPPSPSPH